MIKRSRPLREADAVPGAVYVDDWVTQMLAKERRNNVGRPIAGSVLSIKFIKNVKAVLSQCFDFAIEQRPAPIEVNPARGIRLPKQDRREMHFLQDEQAYLALRCQLHAHFQPVLDFLVGTGARYGEAAGLLVRNLHLDAERPFVDIRLVLKWVGRKWKLGRPKTRSSVRRITLSPRLVQILRPLVEGKEADAHVFTMLEGGPLHHGNFTSRYFKPAVQAASALVPKKLRIHDLRHTHAAWLISDRRATSAWSSAASGTAPSSRPRTSTGTSPTRPTTGRWPRSTAGSRTCWLWTRTAPAWSSSAAPRRCCRGSTSTTTTTWRLSSFRCPACSA